MEAMKARIEANKKAAAEKPPEEKKEPAPKPAEPAAAPKPAEIKKPAPAKKDPVKKEQAKKDPATKKDAVKKEPAKKKAASKRDTTKRDGEAQTKNTTELKSEDLKDSKDVPVAKTIKPKPLNGIKGGVKLGLGKSKLDGLAKKKLTPQTTTSQNKEDDGDTKENKIDRDNDKTADSSPAKESQEKKQKTPVKVVAPSKPIIGFKRKLGGALGGAGNKFGGGSTNISDELKKRLFS